MKTNAEEIKPGEHGEFYARNDTGNAERFLDMWRHVVRFSHGLDCWFVFTGERWERSPNGAQAIQLAIISAKKMKFKPTKEAEGKDLEKMIADFSKFKQQSANRNALHSCISVASTNPAIAVEMEDFNKDVFLLNFTNGTLDLKTGILRKHDHKDMITQTTGIDYVPDAPRNMIEQCVADAFEGEPEVAEYFQCVLGYCLNGSMQEQLMHFLSGDGGNGKNTIIEHVMETMGEYSSVAAHTLLIETQSPSHPTAEMALLWKRMVLIQEAGGKAIDSEKMKRLATDKEVTARGMGKDFVTFNATHTIIAMVNGSPPIKEKGFSITRRLSIIPFDKKISNPDRTIPDRLKMQREGTMAWLVEGHKKWANTGLVMPLAVSKFIEKNEEATDNVIQFLDDAEKSDRITATYTRGGAVEKEWVKVAKIREEYVKWCKAQGIPERDMVGRNNFHKRLIPAGWEIRITHKTQESRKKTGLF